MPTDRDDATLVTAARAGEREAFAELVERHVELVRAVCSRWLDDPSSMDDVVQDAVVTALTDLHLLRRPASFGPWLAGIAKNTARRRPRGTLSLETVLGGRFLPELPDPTPAPDDVVADRDTARHLALVVGALPAGQAAAVTAFYLRGLSLVETAEHLGTSVDAVKNRLHKARISLRAQLAGPTPRPEETTVEIEPTVRMHITGVRRLDGDVHVIVLSDDTGDRTLPIWVGAPEAIALAFALDGTVLPRPDTHQLSVALLTAAGGRITAVDIVGLVDGVYYARLTLADGATVDARPSDALNIAMLVDAPIHVTHPVLDAAAASRRTPPDGPSDHPAITARALAAVAAAFEGR